MKIHHQIGRERCDQYHSLRNYVYVLNINAIKKKVLYTLKFATDLIYLMVTALLHSCLGNKQAQGNLKCTTYTFLLQYQKLLMLMLNIFCKLYIIISEKMILVALFFKEKENNRDKLLSSIHSQ